MSRHDTKVPLPSSPGPVAPDHQQDLLLDLSPDPKSKTGLLWTFAAFDAATGRRPDVAGTKSISVMRPGITQFDLHLDDDYSFTPNPNAMTLASSVPPEYRDNYTDLSYFDPKHIRFYARYINEKRMLVHKCFFYAKPNHLISSHFEPIDPDILNPGDRPHGLRHM
ncbi:MAG TPA: hypothetical protein VHZ29_13065 [Rhizomicrobium sp.]|jgi:hypothetical protein|nr:hypothetical protein [Rhizomicrobium sp.]